MKNIYEIGAKTGLTRKDVKRIAGLGLFGLAALFVSFFSSCAKNCAGNKQTVKPSEDNPKNTKELLDSVKKSTSIISNDNGLGNGCGPTPNYPCGTRYYTVSALDFKKVF